jgi:CubicO group peptidase (beta-lactamase class C family)
MKQILLYATLISIIACKPNDNKPLPATEEVFNNPLQSTMDKDLHQMYGYYKAQMKATSISIGILENNNFHTYGYGETILGNRKAPNGNTFYEIGSITKVFTSLLTSIWMKENNINLTTPIKNYLPNTIPTLTQNNVAINFKHLLTHTSGLLRDPQDILNSPNIPLSYAQYDSVKLYQHLRTAILTRTPGDLYDYSNIGFGTLGVLLERQYKKNYEQLVSEKIATPLGMGNTKITLSSTDAANEAKPYEGNALQPSLQFQAFNGAGGIRSTTYDMLQFANACINGTTNNQLNAAMQECEMIHFLGNELGGGPIEVGLGWHYLDIASDNKNALTHSGATFGHSSFLLINKKKNKALVFFITMPKTNVEETAMQNFVNEIIIKFII